MGMNGLVGADAAERISREYEERLKREAERREAEERARRDALGWWEDGEESG